MSSGANAGLATGLVSNSYLVKSYHVFSSVNVVSTHSFPKSLPAGVAVLVRTAAGLLREAHTAARGLLAVGP